VELIRVQTFVALADREDALEHDKHARRPFTRRKQARPARVDVNGTKTAYARDLGLGEHRKELVHTAREPR
jgi:hypothetical protein